MKKVIDEMAVRTQLVKMVESFGTRISYLMRSPYKPEWLWSGEELADALYGQSTQFVTPHMAASWITNGILDPCDWESPRFWGSPLGRMVAFWGTGEPGTVRRGCAAAALDMTRQNVSLMLRDGRLSEPVNAGTDDLVSTSSLAMAMRQRFSLRG